MTNPQTTPSNLYMDEAGRIRPMTETTNATANDLEILRQAVRLYLNEYDNPLQDLTMKRQRLNDLRKLVR